MPFGINLQRANDRPASLQNIARSLFGDPNYEAKSGFFAGLSPFLKSVATVGGSTLFSGFGNGDANKNPMEIPTITTGGKQGGFSLPDIFKNIPNINIGSGNTSGGNSDLLKWLLPLLAGVAGGLDNRSQKSTTTPSIDPALTGLRDKTISSYTDLLSKDPDLKGYTASGIDDLNRSGDIQKRLAEETLAARGVNGPAVGTSLNSIDNSRFAAINKFKQSIPLLKDDLTRQNAGAAGSFVNASPRSVTTETSGNILGGAIGGGTELLAYLYGLGRI